MPESGTYGSVRGVPGNGHPYRDPIALVLPQIRDGKLIPLAVNVAKRSATLPDVPTLHEAGYHDAEYPIWFGLFAPTRTPQAIVEKLNRETVKVLQSAQLREKLLSMGIEPMMMTSGEFTAYVAKEIALNASLAKNAGLKAE